MRSRKKICAGNWKLNKSPSDTRAFLAEWSSVAQPAEGVEVVIFPPAYDLSVFSEKAGSIKFGPQNICFAKEGAFTGEISPDVVKSMGSTYALIGHSERRTIFGESDELIAKKIQAALAAELIPMLCIGELLEERKANKTEKVLLRQLREGLALVKEHFTGAKGIVPLVVAYEPVWAIGTGLVATPEQAEEAHAFIRAQLNELIGTDDVSILYGGSVKPDNAAGLRAKPNIDGFLVGGASLKVTDFKGILGVF